MPYQTVSVVLKARDQASAQFRKVQGSAGGLSKSLLNLKTIVAGAIGGYAVKQSIQSVVAALETQQRAETKLSAIHRATGGAVGYTTSQLKAYARHLQASTTFGDEAIINGQALLASFKNVRGEVYKDATSLMLDLSAAMDQDLKSSAVQLGKALNDPLKGLTALSRIGVTFSEEQKTQIKNMVAQNDLMGAQGVILNELASEFGGTAKKMATTGTGQLRQIGNAFGDFKESVAKAMFGAVGDTRSWADYTIKVLKVGGTAVENYGLTWQIVKTAIKLQLSETYDYTKWTVTERIPGLFETGLDDAMDYIRAFGQDARGEIAGMAGNIVDSIAGVPDEIKKRIKQQAGGAPVGPMTGKQARELGVHPWEGQAGASRGPGWVRDMAGTLWAPDEKRLPPWMRKTRKYTGVGAAGVLGTAVGHPQFAAGALNASAGKLFGGVAVAEIVKKVIQDSTGTRPSRAGSATIAGTTTGTTYAGRGALMALVAEIGGGASFGAASKSALGFAARMGPIPAVAAAVLSLATDQIFENLKRSKGSPQAAAGAPGLMGPVSRALAPMMFAAVEGGPQASPTTIALREQLAALKQEFAALMPVSAPGALPNVAAAFGMGAAGGGGAGAISRGIPLVQSRFLSRAPGQGIDLQQQINRAAQQQAKTMLRVEKFIQETMDGVKRMYDVMNERLPKMETVPVE